MVMLLDGGSTSVLDHVPVEDRSSIMLSPLWTSQALFSCPEAVKALYEEYILAGANLISCMTYQQSSLTMQHVSDIPDAYDVGMRVATESCSERDVSAVLTLGTHAAMLSNGAEYSHTYQPKDINMLRAFHAQRLEKFASMPNFRNVQYIAFETLPDVLEAEVILDVINDHKETLQIAHKRIWISFSCSGDGAIDKLLAGVLKVLNHKYVHLLWGLGINCFKEDMADVVPSFCKLLSDKGLYAVIYRDAGPYWDPVQRVFVGDIMQPEAWAKRSIMDSQYNDGRVVIGGCCQTTPAHIAALKAEMAVLKLRHCKP